MKDRYTIKNLTERVETASTEFEMNNTELKRKYLIWNISIFNKLASKVSVSKGTFGTGYPFYALDENLQGKLPIIQEQIRYNRQLVRDGRPIQKSIWLCKNCLEKEYSNMPDLKKICKPCPNMLDKLKPRKIINRLPDIDMWLICEDGKTKQAEEEFTILLQKYKMDTSDLDPLLSIENVSKIANLLKNGEMPKIFLPLDAHIIEYSKLKELIEKVPRTLQETKEKEIVPYLPIQPRSYRKKWQYDDEAYNFICDYLSSFTPFEIPEGLRASVDNSRKKVASEFTSEELFGVLLDSATKSSFRRFQSVELKEIFMNKVDKWKRIQNKTLDDDLFI